MQVNADWTMGGTAKHLEGELIGLKFRGPGLYLSDTDTLLIVSMDPVENEWSCPNSRDKVWRAYIYNCKFQGTILRYTGIPVRSDKRK